MLTKTETSQSFLIYQNPNHSNLSKFQTSEPFRIVLKHSYGRVLSARQRFYGTFSNSVVQNVVRLLHGAVSKEKAYWNLIDILILPTLYVHLFGVAFNQRSRPKHFGQNHLVVIRDGVVSDAKSYVFSVGWIICAQDFERGHHQKEISCA